MQNERKIKFILYLRGYDILEWQAYTVQLWSGRWVEKVKKACFSDQSARNKIKVYAIKILVVLCLAFSASLWSQTKIRGEVFEEAKL